MPTLDEARVTWYGEKPTPAEAWSCSYGEDDIFVFVFWPLGSCTQVGLFPVGSGEELLNTSLIGQWKQADQSLRSTGRFEPRKITLLAPELSQHYYDDMLKIAGKACTAENTYVLARQVAELFLIRAHQFISNRDARAAARFMDDHRWAGDIELPERILDDLANWNHQVVPYIQDLPGRVRGVLLEPGSDGRPAADVWQQIRDLLPD